MKCYLIVVSICTSLIINDSNDIFTCFLVTCVPFLEKHLLHHLPIFICIAWVWFFLIELQEYFLFFGNQPLIRQMTCRYLLLLELSIHHLNDVLWHTQNILILSMPSYSFKKLLMGDIPVSGTPSYKRAVLLLQ